MAQLSATRIINALFTFLSSLDATDEAKVRNTLWRQTFVGHATDGGTAGTAQTETPIWVNNTGETVKITSVKITTPVNVTANATNYATFTVNHRTSAGASATAIIAFATDTPTTDDITAFAPKSVTPTAGNDLVPVGGVVTLAVSKTAAGVAIAAATSQARVNIQYEPVS
jgi:hypothetical protein